MGTIILHAGMPKAGSSAIQRWLGSLRDDPIPNLTPVVGRIRASGVSVEPHTSGTCNSGIVIEEMRRAGTDSRNVVHQFTVGLDELAKDHPAIVLSGEALAQPFWQKDRGFLGALDSLGESHEVVVFYYVRPQDSALEAAWRQWGFRTGFSPEQYVRHRAEQMDYLDTFTSMERAASRFQFHMRPFRRDLLTGGDVVADFAYQGLGLALTSAQGQWDSNVGLALDIVNLLAKAPAGLLGTSPHENRQFARVKASLEDIDVPTSENAAEGREILRAWAHKNFEARNQELIFRLGWPTDHFISGKGDIGDKDLSRLDERWSPRATDAELAGFFGLVQDLVSSSEHPPQGAGDFAAMRRELQQLQSQVSAENRRRIAVEQKLDALLGRRVVRAALRGADFIGRQGYRRRLRPDD